MTTDLEDTLVANPGRLRILTSLARDGQQEFVRLRGTTRLTDGNLACHARKLASAGLVSINKQLIDGKPKTEFRLTPEGRAALESHVQHLMGALGLTTIRPHVSRVNSINDSDDDWID
jgi:DNA-binding MarR family transcriptional regulator